MTGDQFREIREHLKLDRKAMAELLGLSGYNAISNIELGLRNPSRLAVAVLRMLYALPRARANELMELLRKSHE